MKTHSVRPAALAAALALCLSLSSCGPDLTGFGDLRDAVRTFSEDPRREADFQAEAVFRDPESGEGSVLYSISGHMSCDASEPRAEQSYTATYLAKTLRGEDLFLNGEKIHTEDGETVRSEADTEAVLSSFPFSVPLLPAEADVQTFERASNLRGVLYTVTAPADAGTLEALCGWDWYGMAGIRLPDRDRESFGPLTCRYTLSGGKLVSFSAECTFRIYAAAGYTPGYSDPEANGLELSLRLQWSYSGAD